MAIDINCIICTSGWHYPDGKKTPCPKCRPAQKKKQYAIARYKKPNQKSEKKKAIEAVLNPFRAEWCKRVKFCMVCHIRKARHVHEIVAGSGRHLSVEDPLGWMACCSKRCHDKVQGIPFEEQLEYVMESYRRSVNRCGIRNAV